MKEINVKWMSKTKSISQVYNSGLQYAFLDENFEMIHQLVYCKDFMQDAIAGFLQGQKMSIYGFSYDPKTCLPIYRKKTRLLVVNSGDKAMPNKIDTSKEFLSQVEKKLKMFRTQIYKVKNPQPMFEKSGAFVFDGSSRWMISPPMISLYTLLIRISFSHVKGTNFMTTIDGVINGTIKCTQNNDVYQLKSAKKAIGWILEKTDKNLFHQKAIDNYKGQSVSTMHNDMGIVAYAAGYPKYAFPKWYEGVNL